MDRPASRRSARLRAARLPVRAAALLLAAAGLSTALPAHDCWIEPTTFFPGAGERFGVRLFVGHDGESEEYPRRAEKIVRFVALGPGAPAEGIAIAGDDGAFPAGSVALDAAGIHVLGYRNSHSTIELEPAKLEAYLREEGLDSIIARRAELGESERPGRERYSRCAKAIVSVGPPGELTPERAAGFDRPLGLDLEIVPERAPHLLRAGEELPVRLLHGGKPLAGALVAAWNRSRPDFESSARTDAEGRARLPISAGGRWVVATVHMTRLEGGEQDWESLWSTLAFEIPAGAPEFAAEVALHHGAGLGGCAIGDLDPARDGNEIAAVAADGAALLAWREPAAWRSATIHDAPGELIQVAAGDVIPEAPGDELVAVGVASGDEDSGAKGVAVLLRRDGDAWRAETIFEDDALLHAVAISFGWVFVAGSTGRVHQLSRAPDGEWRATPIGDLPGPGRCAAVTGSGIAFACRDGSLALVRRGEDRRWDVEIADRRESGRARIAARNDLLLSSDDDGVLSLIDGAGRTELFRAAEPLRGAVFVDLRPEHIGAEIATAGYSGEVTLLPGPGQAGDPLVVARDRGRIHHLASGHLGFPSTPALVAASRSGRLVVIRRP